MPFYFWVYIRNLKKFVKIALKGEKELVKRTKINGGKISVSNNLWKIDRKNFFNGI